MTYNLSERRPKVLLLGNGINLLLKNNSSVQWSNLLGKLSSRENLRNLSFDGVPYTIQATALCDKDDANRVQKIKDVFHSYQYGKNDVLHELLNLDFDAILTTNYTYEIEQEINSSYLGLVDKTKWADTYNIGNDKKRRKETKRLIKTYNHIPAENGYRDVWHIHGELRIPGSIVLTHDDYGRLISKVVDYLSKEGKKYNHDYESMEFCSWIDYLVLGDVYIVGLGLDFSEFDLWWILSRRTREIATTGRVMFYEAYADKCFSKQEILKVMDVDVRNIEFLKVETKDFDYSGFYTKVIQDIKSDMRRSNYGSIQM